MKLSLAAVATALLFLAACHQIRPDRALQISVSPEILESGHWVTVTAGTLEPVALRYVSGTVAVMGAPVLPLKYDRQLKKWAFKTYIPEFVSLPPGLYSIKAWGQTDDGVYYEGTTTVKAK
jgi:hypothetical protein